MRALLLLLGFLATVPAHAQSELLQAHAATSSFTGPGDIVASATTWYGLRGYSAAYAAPGTGKSVSVRRASDNATQDIVILTTGAMDVASYNTFVGTDATASCTIAGTAMSCSGASATIHVNDPVTGVGITNPCTVTATNGSTTATASLAGTSTTCGTVGVAETVTFQVAGFIPKWYDQSGNGSDAVQATAGSQPQLLLNCVNSSLPCVFFNSYFLTSSQLVSVQPITYSFVSNRTTVASYAGVMQGGGASPVGPQYNNVSGSLYCYAGNVSFISVSEPNLHAVQCVANGASSASNVDGTDVSSLNFGTTVMPANPTIGSRGASVFLEGYIPEVGDWSGTGFNSTQRGNMRTNQSAYYGTP